MARFLVALRWLIVVAWIAAGVAAFLFLPTLGGAGASPLNDIIPEDSPSLRTAERTTELFGAPAATDVVVVQRDPEGLSKEAYEAHLRRATETEALPDGVLGAVPLANLPLPGIGWNEEATTAVAYLFMSPELSLKERQEAAEEYVGGLVDEGETGITGAGPARLAQFDVIQDALPIVEIATLAVIVLMVFLYFRSLLAPLVTLGTAALAYIVAIRGLAWSAEQLGTEVPQEIEPLLVVLLLGLVTDYTVFFLAEARRRMLLGDERLPSAREATARVGPMVLTAGLLVASCCAALLAGELEFFRIFGPGLALCAVVVTLVSVTLVPALLGILGPWLFGRRVREAEALPPLTGEETAISSPAVPLGSSVRRERLRRRFAGTLGAVRAAKRTARDERRSPTALVLGRLMASRAVSLVIVLVCVAGLGWAARDDLSLDLGVSYVRSLPEDTEARSAGDDAAAGFDDGILAPTEILVEREDLGERLPELAELQQAMMSRDGVAVVLGPSQQIEGAPNLLLTEDGQAARFVLILDGDPTSAGAIEVVGDLQEDFTDLVDAAGLPGDVRHRFGGEAPLGAETVDAVKVDMGRIAVAVAIVTLVLLAIFLRALVAPFVLLFAGALGFLAALGLTAMLSELLFDQDELTYYVPLVGLVLLVALGSDYNVLIAGRIRAEARTRRIREAIAVAAPQASRAITVAGLTLAATFALLTIVPLRPFRELGILLAVGVLVDSLVVRPLLIPALLSLLGRVAWWPAQPLRAADEDELIQRIARLGALPEDEARSMARSTLCTLGERIGSGQARELGAHLPDSLAEPLQDPAGCDPFGYEEFIDRVAERQGVDVQAAARGAGAVMATLRETVPSTELDYVRAALSEDYRPLLGDVPRGVRVRRR